MKKIILFVIALTATSFAIAQNQLINSGFEKEKSGWNFWGGEPSTPGRNSSTSLKVFLDKANWSGVDQTVQISEGTQSIYIAGWMKTENVVQGSNTWEKARIAIEYKDASGNQIGGYPPITGEAKGTSEWIKFERTYYPQKEAKSVKIQAVLANCTGTVWFDDLELIMKDATGKILTKGAISGPIDKGKWYEIEVDRVGSAHYVDWSNLLDAPAGKHGYIKAVGDHLEFENGKQIRFWGTNLVARSCFPTKEDADVVGERLSKMGCNLIRLHHMDAPWSRPNLFGNKTGTRKLDTESIDKMDYLISKLKEKGIYVYLDLLVHRAFTLSDGIAESPGNGAKQVGYLEEDLIELQKEFITQLLNHKNKYTGLAYKDEPAVVGSEFINEASAFMDFGGDVLKPNARKNAEVKFNKTYPGKTLCRFDYDWSIGGMKAREGSSCDVSESMEFYSFMEQKYYKEMYEHMRNLGVKYPLSGSNYPPQILAYKYDNNKVNDLILTNDYWDHPQLWKIGGDWSKVLYAPIDNLSMIKSPKQGTIPNISKQIQHNKPFMVTEYNACYPNEYILEGIPLVAAYSALQGVDGMLQFDFTHGGVGTERISGFSLSKMPEHLAHWVAAAPMVLRGDIQEAEGLVLDPVTKEKALSLPSYSNFLDVNYHLPFITKVAKSFNGETIDDASNYSSYFDEPNGIIKSQTGELTLNSKQGRFTVDAPNVQGVTGNLKDQKIELSQLTIEIKNEWASVMAVSKDDKPLSSCKEFYLIVVGPTKMTNQKYNDQRQALDNIGQLPVLAQVVEGMVTIKGKVKVYPLSINGNKGEPLITSGKQNTTLNTADGRTFVYLVTKK